MSQMKRKLSLAFAILSICWLFTSCDKDTDFDENLLLGKWKEGTEYYRYDSGHSGATWDTGDDMGEEEALPFTWELSGDRLVHYHTMQGGQVVPQAYTLTKLSSNELEYHDLAKVEHKFIKTN